MLVLSLDAELPSSLVRGLCASQNSFPESWITDGKFYPEIVNLMPKCLLPRLTNFFNGQYHCYMKGITEQCAFKRFYMGYLSEAFDLGRCFFGKFW